ncbi:hypothetical protein CHU92_13025 [Flavobacterium cyanobacteriorum]|uniref:O-antigen polymerase n=1 Tax=Flavobacterium cyanobacteriorum TaxID=2022802 RepID=A0A255YVV2_9FLAO|nr:hypothetical protein [Flavobacterium cyanobacteriorum]OYQ33309.1 hypothetical protein CHU92_13025 [Flavobacterium cyanobacteriorum]
MIIKIPHNIWYQFLFVLCVTVPYLNNYELTFSVWLLTCLLSLRTSYSISLLKLLASYLLILLIAVIVSFFYKYEFFFRIRDITYLSKPVIGFLIGYQLCRRNFQNAFPLIINTGLFIALCHLAMILVALLYYHARTVADLRMYAGYFSDYEIYTLVFLIFHREFGIKMSRRKWLFYTAVLATSSFLYLARTNFIQFAVLILAIKGYFALTPKAIKIFTGMAVFLVVGYLAVLSTNPRRKAEGFEGFLYKIKVAPLEPFKTKVNRFDYIEFNDNYRSHENIMTVRQVTADGIIPTFFGKGIGSQVDLKQKVYLGDMELRYISILHNGFMIVFLKAGIIGVLIYLYTIIFFFKKKKSTSTTIKKINLLFIGTGIFLLISNWVFLGFYNLTESKSVLIGFLIAYREITLKNEKHTIHTSVS